MTDEDRIRELEKRVEKLENRNRNIGRILWFQLLPVEEASVSFSVFFP